MPVRLPEKGRAVTPNASERVISAHGSVCRAGIVAGLVGAVVMLLGAASPAAAEQLLNVTCPSATFCAALPSDGQSHAVAVADPTAGGSWHQTIVDEDTSLMSLSCASASFGAAVDVAGQLATSTDPASPGPAR